MRTIRTVAELRTELAERPRPIGLVPTMGALHQGHISLIGRAREASATVVVSLFVNPSQFERGDDLAAYPRDEERDRALAAEAGADVLFAPSVAEVYPPGFRTSVELRGPLVETLEGERRGPEHFRGVTTVVAKLFNMVGPDAAWFGQKDAQQALVIARMVRDLDMPVRIEVAPTLREPDGLAMSSRNAHLEPEERERAASLARALRAAGAAVAAGGVDADTVLAAAATELERAGVEPEYLALRSTEDLSPVERVNGSTLLAVAARVGRARLIDNVVLQGSADPSTPAQGGES